MASVCKPYSLLDETIPRHVCTVGVDCLLMLEISQGLIRTELLHDAGDSVPCLVSQPTFNGTAEASDLIVMQPALSTTVVHTELLSDTGDTIPSSVSQPAVTETAEATDLIEMQPELCTAVVHTELLSDTRDTIPSSVSQPAVTETAEAADLIEVQSELCTTVVHSELSHDTGDIVPSVVSQPISTETAEAADMVEATPQIEGIYISNARKNGTTGRRLYDKEHYCLYCCKPYAKIARHILAVHGDEDDVKTLPREGMQRKLKLELLLRRGDFRHNHEVISLKKGQLVVLRRPEDNDMDMTTYDDFGPCPDCLGFVHKKHMWHHVKQCPHKASTSTNHRHVQKESYALLADCSFSNAQSGFVANILAGMRNDDVFSVISHDIDIQRFGSNLYEKLGAAQMETIRQSMRTVARLILQIRQLLEKPSLTLTDCICPDMFDDVVQGVQTLVRTEFNDSCRPQQGTPSLALKLGYNLKSCASIKLGCAIKNQDIVAEKQAADFLRLYDLEWQRKVSKSALETLGQRRTNTAQLLPLTQDLVKLQQYQLQQMTALCAELETNPTTTAWMNLAKVTLSRLIVFNKRRGGEASRLRVSNYVSRPNWHAHGAEEFKASLSDVETKLCDRLTLVEIVGKRGRKVPVLLTVDLKNCIDTLNECRGSAGINPSNPFVFARGYRNSVRCLRGNDVIREICTKADLSQPDLITSTRLRKYIATVAQLLCLADNECDWLATHLGHDYRVHKKFYRLTESVVELAKVSKLLISADKGQVHKYAGKYLDDINVDGMICIM